VLPDAESIKDLLERNEYENFISLMSPFLSNNRNTRKAVISGWRLFFQWLASTQEKMLSFDDPWRYAQAYTAWLAVKTPAPSTFNNRLSHARLLYKFLTDLDLVQTGSRLYGNPFDLVHGKPNPVHQRRPIYAPAEVKRLLQHADQEEALLILLGAHAGLTGPEVCCLRFEDLYSDCAQICLSLHKKTNTPRRVSLTFKFIDCTPELQSALIKHAETRSTEETQGVLFTLRKKPLTPDQLRSKILESCEKAEVPYKGWHALRNAAGVQMLGSTDRKTVMRTLGIQGRMALRPLVQLSGGGDGRRERELERHKRKKQEEEGIIRRKQMNEDEEAKR